MRRFALISVSDKKGVDEFAKKLENLGFTILSTGGTYKFLKEKGINVLNISEYTLFPEILDGRVKTLHPKVHGAILARRDDEKHLKELEENNIEFIDIVVVNLYPFEATIKKEGVTLEEAIENIDIGGPTMLRSAAKNYKYVTVVVDPDDYDMVIKELEKNGETSLKTREYLAVKVFTHTAKYDSMIQKYLAKTLLDEEREFIFLYNGKKLRYGENSHQSAFVYKKDSNTCEANLLDIEVYHGKELSYNNYVDAEAALDVVKDYPEKVAVSVIKHTNPCGFATGDSIKEAFEMAWQGDIVSAFGSIIAFNRKLDLETAKLLKGRFIEVILAPDYDEEALKFLKENTKNLRIIKVKGDFNVKDSTQKYYKDILGGMLVQDRDLKLFDKFESVTEIKFPEHKIPLAKFTWIATKHTKSNAIVLGFEYDKGKFMVLGMGAGQPNRVDSLRKLAIIKAEENLKRLYQENFYNFKEKFNTQEEFIKWAFSEVVLGSDAFFPFPDTVEEASKYGIKYIVQPGGSIRDKEVIEEANKHGIAMVFTGTRHFKH